MPETKQGHKQATLRHIKTVIKPQWSARPETANCQGCQVSCQSACKTSCTVGNQVCPS